MKSEPLENKRKDVIVYLDDIDNSCNYDFKNSEDGEIFMFDDVKSAVMGLKTELDTWFDVNQDSWESGYVYPHLKKRVFEIIDKWFKDDGIYNKMSCAN